MFATKVDDYGHLTSMVLHYPSQRAYVIVYGDALFVDGTANMDKFKTVAIPMVVVDCLWKSTVGGLLLDFNEDGVRLTEAHEQLGFAQSGCVMSDEAPAFNQLARLVFTTTFACVTI